MKACNTFFFMALVCFSSCKTEADKSFSADQEMTEVQNLAKKYGIELNFSSSPVSNGNKDFPKYDLKQLEEQFKMVADQKALFTEESKQIRALTEEINTNKQNLKVEEYFTVLEKYPLVKSQVIQQYGGKLGFEKLKTKLLAKEDSAKKTQLLKLK